jgi:RNA polymerase sigma-70 factor (ECF subfamily)
MDDTSASLLERLRAAPHGDGWPRFVTLYTPLLLAWARRAGVPDADTPDLIQDVFTLLWQKLPEFRYDPQRGRFRGWLRTVTLNRWRELARRRAIPTAGDNGLSDLPTPESESEAFWEEEYRARLVGRAVAILKADFQPATWQAFWRVVVDGQSAGAAAAELGLTVGAVHAARFRVLARLRQELAGLLE